MKQLLFSLLFFLVHFFAGAQVSDRFTDHDFTTNPEWIGDDSLFTIVSGELRLNGSVGNDAHLVTANRLTDSMEWAFRCRFLLSPSTQNFARFYLASNNANLEAPLNGYYVQLGGVTGNTDSVTLYKQTGSQRTRLIGGRPGTVSKTQNNVAIKVFRDAAGNWLLYSDTSGGTNYVHEGSAYDPGVVTGNYLGWLVRYTAGNNQRFFLDDVHAFMPVPDTVAPVVDSVIVTGDKTVTVFFNEPTDLVSSINVSNYRLDPPGTNPEACVPLNENAIQLTFNESFVSGTTYLLRIVQVNDKSGNGLQNHEAAFLFYQPALHDLLISELMPDPSPAVALPEQEFIELYNNTRVPINLAGYSLSDGSSTAILPAAIVGPDSFVIICAQAGFSFFSSYGKTIGVSNLPSLNNTSDELTLKDKNGQVIHRIAYDLDWYQNAAKSNGGWSMELNYPRQLCKGKGVYSASADPAGGTPGRANSLWSPLADTSAPRVVSAVAVDSVQVVVVFNEPIDTALSSVAISIQPPVAIGRFSISATGSLHIYFGAPLVHQTTYNITLDNVSDCSGNTAKSSIQLDYFRLQKARNFDVLIHEIMADPEPAQQLAEAEYIELYNRSTLAVSLTGWTLSDAGSTAVLPDIALFPDSFLVLTGTAHAPLFAAKTIGLPGFPALGNDGDELVLKNEAGQVIHAVAYNSLWYKDGFKQAGGWSLEMVDPANPCGKNNWAASAHPQGGTPGKTNSRSALNKDETPPRLIRAYPVDSHHVHLFFTEALDSGSLKPGRFLLNGTTRPAYASGIAPFYESTVLTFANAFKFNEVYTIYADSLADCAQNAIEDYRSVDFELPVAADSLSLVINEVLFNPRNGSFDFVELYNKSNNAVDLKTIMLAKRDEDGTISGLSKIAPQGFALPSGGHAVLTLDAADLLKQYHCREPALVIPVALPSYNDDNGTVVLMDDAGRVLDELAYDSRMHFALLDNPEGVSLERIGYDRATQDRSNWTSAAASAGYATPTYKNSQHIQEAPGKGVLELQPATISPDGDGYQDVMNVNYRFNETGYTGSLSVYDAGGKRIRELFRNEILGAAGTYTWDGITDRGDKAAVGIYLLYFEVFTLDGASQSYTAIGVVAAKF